MVKLRSFVLYQSSLTLTDGCPGSQSDSHDAPRLSDELVPSIAAVVEDVVIGFEDAVGQPVLSHELPHVLGRIELGRSGREREGCDVVGDDERLGEMPSGLIEDQDGMSTGSDLAGDFIDVELHGARVAGRKNNGGADAALGTDGAEQIGRLGALIVIEPRPGSLACPGVGEFVLLPNPHLVLEPDLDGRLRADLSTDPRHVGGEVFLKAARASSFCL